MFEIIALSNLLNSTTPFQQFKTFLYHDFFLQTIMQPLHFLPHLILNLSLNVSLLLSFRCAGTGRGVVSFGIMNRQPVQRTFGLGGSHFLCRQAGFGHMATKM